MNKKRFFCLALGFIMCLTLSVSCNKFSGGDWVAKMDNDTITINELNTFYYAQQKSLYNLPKEKIDELAADPSQVAKNPTLDKKEFLEQLIRQRLVYNKASEDKTLKDKEVDALIQMAREAVVVGYYVREKFKNDIDPTQKEVEEVIAQQKDRLKGIPIDQAEMYVKQQIQQQKLQMKIRDLVEKLVNEKGIKKNLDVLKPVEKKEEKKEEKKK